MLDNHMTFNEDKYLTKGDKCSCGGEWEDVGICDIEGEECAYPCPINSKASDCEHYSVKLRCERCGGLAEPR